MTKKRLHMTGRKWIWGIGLLTALLTTGCRGAIVGEPFQTTELTETAVLYGVASAAEIPQYQGDPYVVLADNQPAFSEEEKQCTDAFETYCELDALGRCGQAYANICAELMPTEERQPIGQIRPSGWHTVKYNDIIDGNYLYNRCHLIGYQLAGENANERNLITGTRYLNVSGMLPIEDAVAAYVKQTGNHVLYRVTPVFEGRNLVASGVQIEAWSVEDQGAGICYHIYCYNVQPGIQIDYLTGDSREETAEPDAASEDSRTAAEIQTTQDASQEAHLQQVYIININTKRFHIPSCTSVQEMAEHNKKICQDSMEKLEEQGYRPCERCIDR